MRSLSLHSRCEARRHVKKEEGFFFSVVEIERVRRNSHFFLLRRLETLDSKKKKGKEKKERKKKL